MNRPGMLVAALVVVAGCGKSVAGGSRDGAAIFAASCATCHGAGGKPTAEMEAQLHPRDLTSAEFRARATPALVEHQVRVGSANHLMPAFAGILTDAQITAVARYVTTLALTPAPAAPGQAP